MMQLPVTPTPVPTAPTDGAALVGGGATGEADAAPTLFSSLLTALQAADAPAGETALARQLMLVDPEPALEGEGQADQPTEGGPVATMVLPQLVTQVVTTDAGPLAGGPGVSVETDVSAEVAPALSTDDAPDPRADALTLPTRSLPLLGSTTSAPSGASATDAGTTARASGEPKAPGPSPSAPVAMPGDITPATPQSADGPIAAPPPGATSPDAAATIAPRADTAPGAALAASSAATAELAEPTMPETVEPDTPAAPRHTVAAPVAEQADASGDTGGDTRQDGSNDRSARPSPAPTTILPTDTDTAEPTAAQPQPAPARPTTTVATPTATLVDTARIVAADVADPAVAGIDAQPTTAAPAAAPTPSPTTGDNASAPMVIERVALRDVPTVVVDRIRAVDPQGGVNRAVVRLDPPELGRITLEVIGNGDEISVIARAENAEAARALIRQRADIQAAVQALGLSVSDFDVQHGDTSPREQQAEARRDRFDGRRPDSGAGYQASDLPEPEGELFL
ncbi:MAG: flagellar hook-length control protein FliK [Actinomycetota bacterium]